MYYSNVYWPYAIMFFKNGGACEPTKARDQNPTECLLLSLLMSCFQCPAPAWPAFLRIVSFFGNRGERWAKHCEASGCGEGSPHQDAMPRLWTCEQHRLEDAWSDWSALQISPDMEWHGMTWNKSEWSGNNEAKKWAARLFWKPLHIEMRSNINVLHSFHSRNSVCSDAYLLTHILALLRIGIATELSRPMGHLCAKHQTSEPAEPVIHGPYMSMQGPCTSWNIQCEAPVR